MSLFNSIDVSSSGLTAQRLRMDAISDNIANVNTTRTQSGGPYKRKIVVFESRDPANLFSGMLQSEMEKRQVGSGVRVARVQEDTSPFKLIYDPNHPDADSRGYVRMPNVNVVTEMVDMISATRAYEANVTAVKASKDIALKALEIGR